MLNIDEDFLSRRLERHVRVPAEEIGERNLWRYGELRQSADYIAGIWEESGCRPERQVFQVEGREVRNLEVQLTGEGKADQIPIIGAHYDSAPAPLLIPDIQEFRHRPGTFAKPVHGFH